MHTRFQERDQGGQRHRSDPLAIDTPSEERNALMKDDPSPSPVLAICPSLSASGAGRYQPGARVAPCFLPSLLGSHGSSGYRR
jgi:hypothetical protein